VNIVDSLAQASVPSLSIQANALEAAITTSVQFTSTLTGGVGPFAYVWNFDDGTTSTEVNPSHIFDTPGARNVKLTVTDANGKVAQATTVILLKDSSSSKKLPTEAVTSPANATASGLVI
jgi:PKD repeat protein